MPRFQDIPQFTKTANYSVDHAWPYLLDYYAREVLEADLDVNPDFQRGYVWTLEQKSRYVEYILRGGMSGRDLYFNCAGWRYGQVGRQYGAKGYYVLVDGKQRLDAVLGFMNNEVPIFGGNYFRDYTDKMDILTARFRWNVNDLQTREEVLQWYLDLNSGGTVHSPEELDRVPWVLLAVDRFGSFGGRTAAGQFLERAGLIKPEGDGHVVTSEGAKWVHRINESRR